MQWLKVTGLFVFVVVCTVSILWLCGGSYKPPHLFSNWGTGRLRCAPHTLAGRTGRGEGVQGRGLGGRGPASAILLAFVSITQWKAQ